MKAGLARGLFVWLFSVFANCLPNTQAENLTLHDSCGARHVNNVATQAGFHSSILNHAFLPFALFMVKWFYAG
jgi:hypothetical protein